MDENGKREICETIYKIKDERILQLIRGIVEAGYREEKAGR